MKLHFESDLPYQAAAIEAVCDLFRGQEVLAAAKNRANLAVRTRFWLDTLVRRTQGSGPVAHHATTVLRTPLTV